MIMNYPSCLRHLRHVSIQICSILGLYFIVGITNQTSASALLDFSSENTGIYDTSSYTFGWSFTVGDSDVSIAALGIWDKGGDGLFSNHDVGIWSGPGEPITTVTVFNGVQSPLRDGFRYENITGGPLTLSANTTYYIGAFYPGNIDGNTADFVQYSGNYSFHSSILNVAENSPRDRYSSVSSALSFPATSLFGSYGIVGPNASLTPVPESGTAGIIAGFGIVAFLYYQRKCSAKTHTKLEANSSTFPNS